MKEVIHKDYIIGLNKDLNDLNNKIEDAVESLGSGSVHLYDTHVIEEGSLDNYICYAIEDKTYTVTLPDAYKKREISIIFDNPFTDRSKVIVRSINLQKIQSNPLEGTDYEYWLEKDEEFVTLLSDGKRWRIIAE